MSAVFAVAGVLEGGNPSGDHGDYPDYYPDGMVVNATIWNWPTSIVLTITYASVAIPETTYTVTGTINVSGSGITDGTYTITVQGTATFTGTPFSEVSINATVTGPMTGNEPESPTSVTGTITVDGVDYDLSTLNIDLS